MSMICTIQAFDGLEENDLKDNPEVADASMNAFDGEYSFPLGLFVVQFIFTMVLVGGLIHSFSGLWYLWLALGLITLVYMYYDCRKIGKGKNAKDSLVIRPVSELYVDKAWHGLHYLLTQSDWEGEEPFCYLVKGGFEIGSDTHEYGSPRLLTMKQAKKFSDAISKLSIENLKQRFNPEKMKELGIYPNEWDNQGEYEYLMGHFNKLKAFLMNISQKDFCLVISLS
ncbi:MAG: YfbM family protein [Planctomycetota bacterium]|jgi:hypothetical protein